MYRYGDASLYAIYRRVEMGKISTCLFISLFQITAVHLVFRFRNVTQAHGNELNIFKSAWPIQYIIKVDQVPSFSTGKSQMKANNIE